MRIAVLADTHNHLPAAVRSAVVSADEIWHLGDVGSPALLQELRGLGPPVTVVRGNCDPRGLAPETLLLERGGHMFFLIHEPPAQVPPGARFALHGHTHVPRDETIHGVRYLNPGTVSKPNRGAPPSWGWLEITPEGAPQFTITALD
jgi:putative phosphoesterase